MFTGMPALTREEQESAVERIHTLMQEGMSSGEAIAQVAAELREQHQGGEQIRALFDEDDSDEDDAPADDTDPDEDDEW